MRYARLENNIVMEIIDFNPLGIFSLDLIFVECDDLSVQQGWVYDNGIFNKPITYIEITEEQKQAIISQLYSLDKIINRTQEQLIQDNNLICTHQPILDAIAEKEALREQLRLLV